MEGTEVGVGVAQSKGTRVHPGGWDVTGLRGQWPQKLGQSTQSCPWKGMAVALGTRGV